MIPSPPLKLWQEKPFLAIILFSLLLRIIYTFVSYPLWWDSHIYIGIGKYIFSSGEIGVWESFRPLIHSLLLGLAWKLGINPTIFGKVLDIILSTLAVALLYIIAKRLFDKKVAIISALLFSLTPLFIMLTGLILTEPLAIVFGLFGVLFFIKEPTLKNLFIAGIFFSLSCLTKFPQGVWFIAASLVLLFVRETAVLKGKKVVSLGLGFILPLIPYFILNYFLYQDILEPFKSGSWIVTTSTWLYGSGPLYYFLHFFGQNPLFLLFIPFIIITIKQKQYYEKNQLLLILIPLLTIIYFLTVPRKEVRYLVTIIPFLALASSIIIINVYHHLRKVKKPTLTPSAWIVFILLLLFLPYPAVLSIERAPTFEPEIRNAIATYNLSKGVLSSDPSFVSFLDLPITTLDGMEFAQKIYQKEQGNYDLLFVNSCDLICAPNNSTCQTQRESLQERFNNENTLIFRKVFEFQATHKQCIYSMYLPR